MVSSSHRGPVHSVAGEAAWLSVVLVAAGIFVAVTSELMPVGLLVAISETLSVSVGVAGLIVTAPGLMAAVAAPATATLLRRIDRKVLLCAAMVLLTSANALSAFAADFSVLVFARLLMGVSIGVFWALAAGLAVRLVPASAVPRATTVVFSGVAVAAVVGVPAGALLGDLVGWRGAFATVSVFSLVATLGLAAGLPRLPALTGPRIDLIGLAVRCQGVRLVLMTTACLVTGHFVAYTFLEPMFERAGAWRTGLGPLLAIFGTAGVLGNLAAGAALARRFQDPLPAIATMLAACIFGAAFPGLGSWGVVLVTGLWGLAWGGVSVSLQTKLMRSAPKHVEAATSLFVSAFNLSICIGALIGGIAIDHLGARMLPAVAGGIVLLSLAVFFRPNPARLPPVANSEDE